MRISELLQLVKYFEEHLKFFVTLSLFSSLIKYL